MQIHSVHDFDDKSAARDRLRNGLVAVDDISGNPIGCAWRGPPGGTKSRGRLPMHWSRTWHPTTCSRYSTSGARRSG
jgi:hypothetical protein